MPDQHEAFMRGFAAGLGLADPRKLTQVYAFWFAGVTETERIDLESGGFLAGLEEAQLFLAGQSPPQ